MSEVKLLPCPCCKGKAKTDEYHTDNGAPEHWYREYHTYHIKCEKCGLSMISDISMEDAIERWNARTYIDDAEQCSKSASVTNGDHIRSMSDDELAEFIFSQVQAKCSNNDCVGADYCYYHADWDGDCGYGCEQAIETWLKEKCEA